MSGPIHSLSQLTPLVEFDLFGVPPTQTSVERDICTEHRPISTLSSSSAIQFNIHTAPDEYVKMEDTELYIRLKATLSKKAGGGVLEDDWKKMAASNYLMGGLFREVTVHINGEPVTPSTGNYAYRAYFDMMFHEGGSKRSHLSNGLWRNYTDFDDGIDENLSIIFRPKTFPAGQTTVATGREVDLLGKLHIDLAAQPRALIGGCDITITLHPNDSSFYMMAAAEYKVSIEFSDACLFVHRSKISQQLLQAHRTAILQSPCKYPLTNVRVKAFTINSGQIDYLIDNVQNGQHPRRIVVALLTHSAYTGDFTKNPYRFQDFGLNYLTAHLDGVQYPSKAYQPDFENDLFSREYYSMYEAFDQDKATSNLRITRNEYKKGYTMFGFNFTPDLSNGILESGHANIISRGVLGLHLRFKAALTETITVLVYMELDRILEIDSNGIPSIDTS